MSPLEEVIEQILKFRDDRDWKKFHNPKDLALALSIEAGELNELFLWKDAKDVDADKLKEELADVLIYAFLLAENQGLDVLEILSNKLKINAAKYPIEKAKGNANKYDQL